MRPLELFFIAALVLYTFAIHAHDERRTMRRWMMIVFGAGLASDILGTTFLCIVDAKGWQFTAHSIAGLAALLIMTIHFIWGMAALRGVGNWATLFNKWSIKAWMLWIAAFVSGTPGQRWDQVLLGLEIIFITYLIRFAARVVTR